MPHAAWPDSDRRAWEQAIATGDPLEEEGPAASWADRTKQTNLQHYSRWLGWLSWSGWLDPAVPPSSRVTRDAVKAYNQHLSAIVAPVTRLSMLVGLKVMMQAMAPDKDWRWLQDACNRVQRVATPRTGKARRVRDTQEIVAVAVAELERLIARRLNEDHIPGPEGRPWQDTTIRGQKERGTGILNNELYIGQLVWNRCSYVKDPRSCKREARPNPLSQWERTAVPELRIIDDELWQRVKARQERVAFEIGKDDSGNALNRAHRRKFLLSGLLTCGDCGGGYTIIGKDRYGCAAHRSKGTCPNDRTISRQEIEGRILTTLKDRLLTAELVEEFARAYQEEVNRLVRDAGGRQAETEAKLAAVQRKIDGILRAIEDGLYQPSMKERLTALEQEKGQLLCLHDSAPRPAPDLCPP